MRSRPSEKEIADSRQPISSTDNDIYGFRDSRDHSVHLLCKTKLLRMYTTHGTQLAKHFKQIIYQLQSSSCEKIQSESQRERTDFFTRARSVLSQITLQQIH